MIIFCILNWKNSTKPLIKLGAGLTNNTYHLSIDKGMRAKQSYIQYYTWVTWLLYLCCFRAQAKPNRWKDRFGVFTVKRKTAECFSLEPHCSHKIKTRIIIPRIQNQNQNSLLVNWQTDSIIPGGDGGDKSLALTRDVNVDTKSSYILIVWGKGYLNRHLYQLRVSETPLSVDFYKAYSLG